jgi:Rad52/22 family double-strand break repair protein
MSSALNPAQRAVPPLPQIDRARLHPMPQLSQEEFDQVLRALEIPFDPNLVQWRITEWSDDNSRGLMMPYADPRAYSDRLNGLFTPAGWTRRYTVQASAPVQRKGRPPAAKILVTCEVTIFCIGTNSGAGEEWSDKDHSLTAAEAQAFKRGLSCFGLGRYLYDMGGEWVELDQDGEPKRIPKLPRWATSKGWLAGLRPKPRKERQALARAHKRSDNGASADAGVIGNGHTLIPEIEVMEKSIGKRMYRGLLKRVARVWSPQQIPTSVLQQQVLAHMQSAARGLARLQAAQARLAPEAVQRIVLSLNAPPAKLEDLDTLHKLVIALEHEAELAETRS